jgi:predicted lysophospholipase L1 biosynthesis ABC-type transport system permease subunit
VVNAAFGKRFWPGEDPVGHRFRTGGRWRRIVGVTRTGLYNRLDEGQWPFYYLPSEQGVPDLDLSLAVRTKGDPAALAQAVRSAVRALDPAVDVLRVVPLRSHVEGVFFPQRMASTLLVMLGAVALLLAGMGVYGVMAYSVARRTQEFGVRMALGAGARDILWAVLRRGLSLAATGAFVGLVLALFLGRLVAGFLYGVSPFDLATYVSVALFLFGVTLLACGLPAWRATRVDPVVALRAE